MQKAGENAKENAKRIRRARRRAYFAILMFALKRLTLGLSGIWSLLASSCLAKCT
jgi:hypothetical protein